MERGKGALGSLPTKRWLIAAMGGMAQMGIGVMLCRSHICPSEKLGDGSIQGEALLPQLL